MDLRITLTGLVALALAACAAPASQTTLTSASVPAASPPAAKEAEKTAAGPGQLACHAETRDDGTTELFLDWAGSTAKGVLRRTAPSGNVTEQTVRAERYKGLIIADDVLATDLVVHAATIVEVGGKKRIRLGETAVWAECR